MTTRPALAASGRVGDLLLYVDGSVTAFKCRCGCRVFHLVSAAYVCNACGSRYEGLTS